MEIIAAKIKEGSKVVPVPRSKDPEAGDPSITDASAGAVAAGVFDLLLARKREEAKELAALLATSTPDSSGESKKAGFTDAKSPRLALVATEMETAQNIALHFLELRFGTTTEPEGAVRWPKEFDLQPVINDIQEFFDLGVLTTVRSPTLDGKLMLQAAEEKGLISDEDEDYDKVRKELIDSAQAVADAAARMGDLFEGGGLPRPPSKGAPKPGDPAPPKPGDPPVPKPEPKPEPPVPAT
jgi:hypothetical protein